MASLINATGLFSFVQFSGRGGEERMKLWMLYMIVTFVNMLCMYLAVISVCDLYIFKQKAAMDFYSSLFVILFVCFVCLLVYIAHFFQDWVKICVCVYVCVDLPQIFKWWKYNILHIT